jgi:hypothetical protein
MDDFESKVQKNCKRTFEGTSDIRSGGVVVGQDRIGRLMGVGDGPDGRREQNVDKWISCAGGSGSKAVHLPQINIK